MLTVSLLPHSLVQLLHISVSCFISPPPSTIDTYMCACMHTHSMHAHGTHAHTQTHAQSVHSHQVVHKEVVVQGHTQTHACAHTQTHTCMCSHTHTHTHTHSLSLSLCVSEVVYLRLPCGNLQSHQRAWWNCGHALFQQKAHWYTMQESS